VKARQEAVNDYWDNYNNFWEEKIEAQQEWDWVQQEKKDREAEKAKEKKKLEKVKGKRQAEEPEVGPSNKKVCGYNFRVPGFY